MGIPRQRAIHTMAPGAWPRHVLTVGATVSIPFAIAALLALARADIAAPTVALVMVVAVVTLAVLTGRRATAILAASSAAAGFDYFHTRPFGSFTIGRG